MSFSPTVAGEIYLIEIPNMTISSLAPSGAVAPIAPQKFSLNCPPAYDSFASYGDAALRWSQIGLNVVPVLPGTQQSAVDSNQWPEGLSPEQLADHWSQYPDHELGAIVGAGILVLDVDSPEASAALLAIEKEFNAWPNMIVKTTSGTQQYFRRAKGTDANPDSHSAQEHPERIGVKTGLSLVMLPPSPGNTLALDQAKNASEFTEASQDFIDAVFQLNGMPPPGQTVCDVVAPKIEVGESIVVHAGENASAPHEGENPLDRYSLMGMSGEIEKQAVEALPVLGQLALKGQATIFYAAPNTGKTLIALSLLIEAIARGQVDPSQVYYINVDDTSIGLSEKVRFGEEYGFHMLAEGYREFTAGAFLSKVKELVQNDRARGVVIVLDTLKKFVDLMDKGKSSGFTAVIRQFVLKGGTVIALAHTNKNLGRDGKPVYGGVSDIVNDFDCAYILRSIAPQSGSTEKVVEFDNLKHRGNVVKHAAYKYSTEHGISYSEILASVQPVDEMQLAPLKLAEQIRSDAEVISAGIVCIGEGINTKMKLADAVAKRAGISKRSAMQIIEKYTGDDPARHRWKYSVRDRGAKVFVILDSAPSVPSLGIT